MTHADKAARIFRVLSAGTRVRMLRLLRGRALCVNALAARLGVTSAAVSQHLRILRDADLVIADKRGYYVHYRVNPKTLAAWKNVADGLLGSAGE